jgi:hypothetical protein
MRVLHTVRSIVSSFNLYHTFFSLTLSSSCLRLFSHLPVTSMHPSIFPSITRCRRQFLHKIWPIQLASLLFTVCRVFLSSMTLCNTSSFLTRSVQLIFHILLQHYILKISCFFWSIFQNVQVSSAYKDVLQMWRFTSFLLNLSPICWNAIILISS